MAGGSQVGDLGVFADRLVDEYDYTDLPFRFRGALHLTVAPNRAVFDQDGERFVASLLVAEVSVSVEGRTSVGVGLNAAIPPNETQRFETTSNTLLDLYEYLFGDEQ